MNANSKSSKKIYEDLHKFSYKDQQNKSRKDLQEISLFERSHEDLLVIYFEDFHIFS